MQDRCREVTHYIMWTKYCLEQACKNFATKEREAWSELSCAKLYAEDRYAYPLVFKHKFMEERYRTALHKWCVIKDRLTHAQRVLATL